MSSLSILALDIMTEYSGSGAPKRRRPELGSQMSADAVRFWELRRIAFNLIVVGIAVLSFIRGMTHAEVDIDSSLVASIISFFIIANLTYCLVYVGEAVMMIAGADGAGSWWRKKISWTWFALAVIASVWFFQSIGQAYF